MYANGISKGFKVYEKAVSGTINSFRITGVTKIRKERV